MMVDKNILVSRQGKGTFIKSSGSGVIHNALCLVNYYDRALRYDVTDSYYGDIIYGTELATRDRGLDFSIFSREFHTLAEAKKLFAKLKYDGLIIDGAFQIESPDYLKELYSNLVFVDGNPESGDIPVAAPDAEAGFSELLKLAAQRPGPVFYLTHENAENYRWRNISFRRAAEKAGIEYHYIDFGKNIKHDIFNHLGGGHYPLILQCIKQYAIPQNTGGTFITACDYMAAKLMIALTRLGYSIPGDFAVSGFVGIGFSSLTTPALTTVKVDSAELARSAVDMLMAQIEGRDDGKHSRLIPVGVVRRESL
jgi:DNA-binding LacI/PurR family transcriptional regulator